MNPQVQEALLKANETRLVISEVRRTIGALTYRDGLAMVADILVGEHDYPDESVEAMRFSVLVTSIHQCGPTQTQKFARDAGLGDVHKRLRDMTNRQRVAASDVLRDRNLLWRHHGRTAA